MRKKPHTVKHKRLSPDPHYLKINPDLIIYLKRSPLILISQEWITFAYSFHYNRINMLSLFVDYIFFMLLSIHNEKKKKHGNSKFQQKL